VGISILFCWSGVLFSSSDFMLNVGCMVQSVGLQLGADVYHYVDAKSKWVVHGVLDISVI